MCGFFRKKRKFEELNPDNLIGDISLKKDEEIDMSNVIQSIFHSESLYDKLKVRCHPDRFVHDELLMSRADDLFKEISDNKRNLKKLQELKLTVEKELKIKI